MLPGSALNGKVVDGKLIYGNRDQPTDFTRTPFEFYKVDSINMYKDAWSSPYSPNEDYTKYQTRQGYSQSQKNNTGSFTSTIYALQRT